MREFSRKIWGLLNSSFEVLKEFHQDLELRPDSIFFVQILQHLDFLTTGIARLTTRVGCRVSGNRTWTSRSRSAFPGPPHEFGESGRQMALQISPHRITNPGPEMY
jgi:hypothetical protein